MIRRAIRGTGKTLIATGVLILLFVAYQLWGTGIAHARDQRKLRSRFAAELATPASVPAAATSPSTTPQPAPPQANVCAECVADISIPKIGLDEIVVEGVGVEELKQGVGHYPDTKLPGEKGNAALAGHRTTYGHPFNRIDELGPGDQIVITTRAGTFHYEWMYNKVVSPETVSVLDNTPDDRLTMTTCNPKYSAAERLIVVAKLMSPPVPPPAATTPTTTPPAEARTHELAAGEGTAGLSGVGATNRPAIAWGILAASVWLAAWAIGRWSGRRWTAYLIGAPIFLVVLFMFFENFARLLPANV